MDVLVHIDVVWAHLELGLKFRVNQSGLNFGLRFRNLDNFIHNPTVEAKKMRSKEKTWPLDREEIFIESYICFKHNYNMKINLLGETRTKILITAESLFAQYGLEGVTLRQITAKAGVNLSSINYHYYDKQSLCREIITLRLKAINSMRAGKLIEAETRFRGAPVPLEEVFGIFAQPLYEVGNDATAYNAASRRLLGRIFVEPLPFSSEILATELQPVLIKFGQAIRRHVPRLPPQDFIWRFSLVVGAMHHAMATLHDMETRTNGVCPNNDSEPALRNFITTAVQAFMQ